MRAGVFFVYEAILKLRGGLRWRWPFLRVHAHSDILLYFGIRRAEGAENELTPQDVGPFFRRNFISQDIGHHRKYNAAVSSPPPAQQWKR